jgi:DNA-binding response OmpR family regulator
VARILIVDDDEAVTGTYVRMLNAAGHEATTAPDTSRGFDQLRDFHPDVLLVDMRMPGESGLEFLRRLRADPEHSELPIGIVTGDYFVAKEVLAEIASLRAVVGYKPIWFDDMSALVQGLLSHDSIDRDQRPS